MAEEQADSQEGSKSSQGRQEAVRQQEIRLMAEEEDADSAKWMVDVLEETFTRDLMHGLEARVLPHVNAIQDATKALQSEVAMVKMQLNSEVQAFETEVADVNDRIREIQQNIKAILGAQHIQ